MIRNLQSDEIPTPIPADIGAGMEFDFVCYKEKGERAVTYLDSHAFVGGKRRVKIETSSWVGISVGAVHTYVQLEWRGCEFRKPNGDKHPNQNTWPNGKPDEAETTKLEIVRLIEQRDINHAKKRNDSWIPRSGDMTKDFWSYDEAVKAATDFFKENFGPGWILFDEEDNFVIES